LSSFNLFKVVQRLPDLSVRYPPQKKQNKTKQKTK